MANVDPERDHDVACCDCMDCDNRRAADATHAADWADSSPDAEARAVGLARAHAIRLAREAGR